MRQPKTIDDLRPAPYNPRAITDEASAGLRESIGTFGDISGIVWNSRTGNLIAGHQRVNQLRKLGAEFVDGALVAKDTRFPVRVVDWPESKERAANVTANNPHIGGVFTDDLADMLDDIKLEIGEVRFDTLALDKLIEDLPTDAPTSEVEEDEAPEPPKNPVTKPGDVWTLGRHTVVCGDSSITDLYPNADTLFTDPPYGIEYVSRVDKTRRKDWGPITNDNLEHTNLADLVRQSCVLRKFSYICSSWESYPVFIGALGSPKSICVWDKGWFGLGKGYRRQHELILFYGTLNRTDLSDLWRFDRAREYKHPTQKPVSLVAKALTDCQAKIVYDPFLGSGTTLIAAEQLDRVCYGVEIEPKYVDVIIERWENLTGSKAQRQ